MAIRRRIRGERVTGFPLPKFTKYARRFQQVVACFLSPKMQEISGSCDPLKGPNLRAEIVFWSLGAVYEELEQAREDNQTDWVLVLRGVVDGWPSEQEGRKLSSSAFYG